MVWWCYLFVVAVTLTLCCRCIDSQSIHQPVAFESSAQFVKKFSRRFMRRSRVAEVNAAQILCVLFQIILESVHELGLIETAQLVR